MFTPQKREELKEEFMGQYPTICFIFENGERKFHSPKVADYWLDIIEQALLTQRKELKEKVAKLLVNTPEEVSRLNNEAGVGTPMSTYAYQQAIGFKEAIDSVLDLLQDTNKE